MAAVTRYQASNVTRLPEFFDRLFQESMVLPSYFDRSFRQIAGSRLWENNDAYTVQIALPGVTPDSCDITVAGNQLTIKGQAYWQMPENATLLWDNLPSGQFMESFTLPAEVDGGKAQAHYNDGILTIVLPKAEHVKARTIKVQSSK